MRIPLFLSALVLVFGCAGRGCTFGPPCDLQTFVSTCDGDGIRKCTTTLSSEPYQYTDSCGTHESCFEGTRGPTCAISLEACPTDKERRCVADSVQICKHQARPGPDGQHLWRGGYNCTKDTYTCVDDGLRAACVRTDAQPCDEPSAVRCIGRRGQTCSPLAGIGPATKHHWENDHSAACEDDEVCVVDGSYLACAVAPAEACVPDVDKPRCVNGKKQRCIRMAGASREAPVYWTSTGWECPLERCVHSVR